MLELVPLCQLLQLTAFAPPSIPLPLALLGEPFCGVLLQNGPLRPLVDFSQSRGPSWLVSTIPVPEVPFRRTASFVRALPTSVGGTRFLPPYETAFALRD